MMILSSCANYNSRQENHPVADDSSKSSEFVHLMSFPEKEGRAIMLGYTHLMLKNCLRGPYYKEKKISKEATFFCLCTIQRAAAEKAVNFTRINYATKESIQLGTIKEMQRFKSYIKEHSGRNIKRCLKELKEGKKRTPQNPIEDLVI